MDICCADGNIADNIVDTLQTADQFAVPDQLQCIYQWDLVLRCYFLCLGG